MTVNISLRDSAQANICPVGDLNNDCQVTLEDLAIFSGQWLAGPGSPADLVGQDGVNLKDYTLLADDWLKKSTRVVISEFMASNISSLLDEDGSSSDWIEIYNAKNTAVSLKGWYLTDKADNLTKWTFPDISIGPKEYLVVFASNKDRRDPASELHTNFSLDAGGEYLALVADDGITVIHKYKPAYVQQYQDISYGLSRTNSVLLPEGAVATYRVPESSDAGTNWTDADFNDQTWNTGSTGFTFGAGSGTDVQSQMLNINSSIWMRIEFTAHDPYVIDEMNLKIKHDDGFVAYINGAEVARRQAPVPLEWNSTATAEHSGVDFEEINITEHVDLLVPGRNVLALQGLNYSITDPDFMLLPELVVTTLMPDNTTTSGYFVVPTPDADNGVADAALGPDIRNVAHVPALPQDNDDIVVTALITQTVTPIDQTSVYLHARVLYGSETDVLMHDDGAHSDGLAGDGIYGAAIPAGASEPGQMVRYYITADDTQGYSSQWPLFKSTLYSEQYLGTVINDPSINTQMPVFWWFVEDPDWYKTNGGTPYTKEFTSASVFYQGEFYDNVQVRLRGASSLYWAFPKQSMKFEFHHEHRFRYSNDLPELEEINLNALWVDKGFIRGMLSFETYRDAENPSCESSMLLGYQNGEFHSVVNFVEQVDELYLQRYGYDSDGVLYKIFNGLSGSSDRPPWSPGVNPDTLTGVEKKTRKWENNSDLQAFVDGISNPTNRGQFMFDNLNIPEVINYMVCNIINQCWDRFTKNYYMYRDTQGNEEWSIFPWDQDLAWGYPGWMNDNLIATHPTQSHPFYGRSDYPSAYGG